MTYSIVPAGGSFDVVVAGQTAVGNFQTRTAAEAFIQSSLEAHARLDDELATAWPGGTIGGVPCFNEANRAVVDRGNGR